MAELHVHIHAPQPSIIQRKVRDCPHCKRPQFSVESFTEWYGWYAVCLGCGEEWQDGEWSERPFRPGWRQDRIKRARARYRRSLL